ncbi:hypothetical protein OHT57_45030 [Streptomyces sp. NBC_00285]|uniref:hypothetical protein n=1 Tax=Streptomyces sp. NBC_00285 TaxID=2975700 RepID=UPI002E2CC42A|nr:hypothetical protein [Streptomyces sp. NBC_00285]
MGERRGVHWRETGQILMLSWMVCAVAWGILSLLDGTGFHVAFPVVVILANWFWNRHRYWAAAAAAACAGSVVVFVLTDLARSHLDRIAADTLATAGGTTVALVVFTGASRLASPATWSKVT